MINRIRRRFVTIFWRFKWVLVLALSILALDQLGVFTHLFETDYYTDFNYPVDGDVPRYANDLRKGKMPVLKPINTYHYEFINQPLDKCVIKGSKHKLNIILIIKSAIEHTNVRETIRKSWGQEQFLMNVSLLRVFTLGTGTSRNLQNEVDLEANTYNDIVQSDFIDTYYNNTIKTMMGIQWAVNFCLGMNYYIFIDDDFYVSTKNLVAYLENQSNTFLKTEYSDSSDTLTDSSLNPVLYAGFTFTSAPLRHKFSKWYISLAEYPYHMFPRYVTGGTIVLSEEALIQLYYASMFTKHFRFDDVFVGIVALKAKISPVHIDEIHFSKLKYDGPDSYRHVITSHGYADENEMFRVWREVHAAGYA